MLWGLGGLDMVLAKMFLSLGKSNCSPQLQSFHNDIIILVRTMYRYMYMDRSISSCTITQYNLHFIFSIVCIFQHTPTFLPMSYAMYSAICHLLTKWFYFIAYEWSQVAGSGFWLYQAGMTKKNLKEFEISLTDVNQSDPILVTWQSAVYEPPEDGFKRDWNM
jgi:hypothetical protein